MIIKGSISRILYASFGGPFTQRTKLRSVPAHKLLDIILSRQAKNPTRGENPVINAALGSLAEAGYGEAARFADRERLALFYRNKGSELRSQGKLSEGMDCLRRASEISPFSAADWFNEGKGFENREPSEWMANTCAIECYDQALEINVRDDALWNDKGCLHHDQNDHERALACYVRALQINPTCDIYWYNKGVVSQDTGKFATAYWCYEQALKLNPRNSNALYNQGWLFEREGQTSEALVRFRKALAINPDDEMTRAKVAKLEAKPRRSERGKVLQFPRIAPKRRGR